MIGYLERALNLRRNEFLPASLLFLYLFLVIGAYIMGQSVGDALFLSVYPNNLPHAIIGTALLIGAFVSVYIRLSHRVRLERLITGVLLFFALSFITFWWLTRFSGKLVYPLIYVWVYTAGAMGPTMGWTLANYLLTTREARRVFGFIGAGAILGAIGAGFVTKVTTGRQVRLELLLLVMAIVFCVCALLVAQLFRRMKQRLADVGRGAATGHAAPKNFRQSLATILESRYLRLITALIAISCCCTTIIGYQFKMIAKDHFVSARRWESKWENLRPQVQRKWDRLTDADLAQVAGMRDRLTAKLQERYGYGKDKAAKELSGFDKGELAAFFGSFYGYMGVASFLLQLILTGRLLRSFGIRLLLFLLPVVFAGGSLLVLLVPGLIAVSILRGSHSVLRYSVDKSTTELLYLPVAPDVKNQIKSFIDTFIWRTADGVAGVVLLWFANALKFSPSRISLVNLAFLGTWFVVAIGVRKEYLNVLRRAIERRTLDPERTATGVLDSTTTEVLAIALQRGDEQQVLYGLSLFELSREPGWHPVLRGLLEHPSAAVRHRALSLLGDAGDTEIMEQVEKLVRDESPEVRTEALHYLVVHAGRDPVSILTTNSEGFPDYSLQGSMVAYLARSGLPENFSAAQLIFETMLARTGEDEVRSRTEAARILGVIPAPSPLHAELMKLLRDPEPEVAEQALLSAGKIQARELLPPLIEKLADRRLMVAARTALVQYGERALGTLQDYLNDPAVPLAVRKQIPQTLGRIPTQQSVSILTNSLIQSDPGLRFDVLKALNKIRRDQPSLAAGGQECQDILLAEILGYYRSFQIFAAFSPQASISRRVPGQESVLTRALWERMDYELERIFRLLGLLYPQRDIHNAFVGLTSGRPQLQANALEVLEHLLQPDIYRMLAYVLDPEITLQQKLVFAERLCRTRVESKTEALRILLHSDDRWLSACALHEVGDWRLAELHDDVQRISHDHDPLMQETWQWTSRRLAATA